MAFTRDYDDTAPANHTLNSAWPLEARKIKVDIADRLSAILSGFVSGETVKGFLAAPFKAVTKPAAITAQIQLYGKTVDGKTELHAEDEDANEIQLTSKGAINVPITAAVVNALAYPIGSIYTSIVSTNPATLLGVGTWVAFAAGRCLVGLDGGQTEFDTVEETGGEKTHALIESELATHTHAVHRRLSDGGAIGPVQAGYCASGGNNAVQTDADTTSTGSGIAHNNLQPYITVYFWKRTA